MEEVVAKAMTMIISNCIQVYDKDITQEVFHHNFPKLLELNDMYVYFRNDEG